MIIEYGEIENQCEQLYAENKSLIEKLRKIDEIVKKQRVYGWNYKLVLKRIDTIIND